MQTITVKFGGTSLASAPQIRKAAEIIRANPARRFVVASAPGKRTKDDIKVTDLLYRCYNEAADGVDFSATLEKIRGRFQDIITELNVEFDIDAEIAKLRRHLEQSPNADYMASRGEYLNSKIIAAYLGFPFVDAAEVIRFRADGVLDEAYTFRTLSAGKGTAVNAGHEHPALCRKGGLFELVEYRHDLVAGMMEDVPYHEHEFEIHPGDRLFVYTDGVPEAQNLDNEMFGTQRMIDSLNRHREENFEEQMHSLREDINAFIAGADQFDDMTMLGFEIKSEKSL